MKTKLTKPNNKGLKEHATREDVRVRTYAMDTKTTTSDVSYRTVAAAKRAFGDL